MRVGVRVGKEDFFYDIHSLVRAFYPDDEVSVYAAGDAEKEALPRDLVIEVSIPPYSSRKAAKDSLKRELYGRLRAMTGKNLPWGTLSGIRPTKIPSGLLREGKTREEIAAYMSGNYLASPEKIELAIRVAENERRILSGIPFGPETFSLYLHVPFCPSICLYCTFSTSPMDRYGGLADAYLEALFREMDRETEMLPDGRRPIPTSFYIGGGTPTALSASQLDRLLAETEKRYDLAAARERTVEAGRPDSITREKLRVLKSHGIDRISVNPQTMNQKTLDLIGRRHTAEDTLKAYGLAREEGFRNINMDIILGLPGEDIGEVSETLEAIRKLKPDSLTVHSLAVKRASRLTRTLKEELSAGSIQDYSSYEGLSFHNSGPIIRMAYETAMELGMEPYYLYRQKNMKGGLENTGFALPGKECLYNILIMEELEEIRAFGAGASKKKLEPGGKPARKINPKDLKTYLERQDEPIQPCN
ncbi:MAG: coproporphyrinogen dehydrogenase HemZ [Lachnospiraceae bacterium]|nr:coproporphyrinogen dehydrogenase HemZ [Lachnospiraceae bacterium]